jgi:hypothetical protein
MESELRAMNTHSHLHPNAKRFEHGVLAKADVLPIFEPLGEEQVRAFGEQLDANLTQLEEKFAEFVTAKSMRGSLGR